MNDIYVNPLIKRYASVEMSANFSDDKKFRLWRKLWIALAETEKELGLGITDEQISELKAHQDDINYDDAEKREKEVRHDVMSHVYAYGLQCPKAKAIIHLGATSCFVGDNADVLIYLDAIKLIRDKLVAVMRELAAFADKNKALATLGFTHFQPAQLTTVGKRAALWLQDLLIDLNSLEYLEQSLKLRGIKGTTGTQASFLELFNGDSAKVKELERLFSEKFKLKSFGVTGQTYPRKMDYNILTVLSEIAQSAAKFGNDIRLLQNMKEIEEPFEKNQIGSSAMAYKRNPMRSERLCSLSRFVMSCPINAAMTASTQWFERTLDDSANKRIVMAQAFMAIDAVLSLYINIVDGIVVYPNVINSHISAELPFMATEVILMDCVKAGGDRQELHEKIRVHSMAAAKVVKEDGKPNDLIDRIKKDDAFSAIHKSIDGLLKPSNFIGRAAEQVDDFLKEEIYPVLNQYSVKTQNVKIDV